MVGHLYKDFKDMWHRTCARFVSTTRCSIKCNTYCTSGGLTCTKGEQKTWNGWNASTIIGCVGSKSFVQHLPLENFPISRTSASG